MAPQSPIPSAASFEKRCVKIHVRPSSVLGLKSKLVVVGSPWEFPGPSDALDSTRFYTVALSVTHRFPLGSHDRERTSFATLSHFPQEITGSEKERLASKPNRLTAVPRPRPRGFLKRTTPCAVLSRGLIFAGVR